jgi:hypothetical protein
MCKEEKCFVIHSIKSQYSFQLTPRNRVLLGKVTDSSFPGQITCSWNPKVHCRVHKRWGGGTCKRNEADEKNAYKILDRKPRKPFEI